MNFLPSRKNIERLEESYVVGRDTWTLIVHFDPPLELATDDTTDSRSASPVFKCERTQEEDDGYSVIGHKRLTKAGVSYTDEDGNVVEAWGRVEWKNTER